MQILKVKVDVSSERKTANNEILSPDQIHALASSVSVYVGLGDLADVRGLKSNQESV